MTGKQIEQQLQDRIVIEATQQIEQCKKEAQEAELESKLYECVKG